MISFIFTQANEENLGRIKACLDIFANWSGQKINYFKSIIIFSKNTSRTKKSRLANFIGINASNKKEKHLGIPIASGRDIKVAAEEIIEKVKQCLQGWKMKSLSQAGRVTLITSVASSIPSYQASSLILPPQICSENFGGDQRRKISMIVVSKAGTQFAPLKMLAVLTLKKWQI